MVHDKIFKSRTNKKPEPQFLVTGKTGIKTLWTPSMIKERIANDDTAAKHALLRIYSFQTRDEQNHGGTTEANSRGFGALDAEILSSFAEQLEKKGWLSTKQMSIVKKRLPKYGRQLFSYIIEEFMNDFKKDIGEKNVWELLRYTDYQDKLIQLANEKKIDWDKVKTYIPNELVQAHVVDISLSNLGF